MTAAGHNDVGPKLAEESEILGESQGKTIESRFECPICLLWLKDPMLTSCGHKFCSGCITEWLKKEGACCPIDNIPLDPTKDLFEDRYTSREISQQKTNCPYRQFGCKAQMSPVEMEKHIQEEHAFKCPFKDFGCSESFQNEEAFQKHTVNNMNSHLEMAANALSKLTSQVNQKAIESKFWDPPPKSGMNAASGNDPSPDWQKLLDKMYERIVTLEQQNRELTIAMTNHQTKFSALQTSLRFIQDEMNLRNCNGVYIWRISSFSNKLTEMMSDPLKMFYSPGFYTSPMGYKICARINVSSKDPDFLSVLLHVMQSENDDALDWPFDGTICFVLVHPYCNEKSIREKTISRPDLEAFRRPVCDSNKRSFGYTEFVRIQELRDFMQNDRLVFRIEVKPCERFEDCDMMRL